MKFLIVTLALLGAVAADVSHLNNMYLPPHMARLGAHKHVEYAQQSQDIPQVSAVELTDNSVVEETSSAHVEPQGYGGEVNFQTEQKQYHTGAVVVPHPEVPTTEVEIGENKYYTGAIVVPHPEVPTAEVATEEKKYYTGLVYKPGQEGAAASVSVSSETSVSAPGSDTFTQQQAAYWTSVGQTNDAVQETEVPAPGSDTFTQEQAAHYTSVGSQQEEEGASASTSTTVVEEQAQEPEQEYYTGLVYKPGQESASATTVVEEHSQTFVAPGSDDFTQQQAAHWTAVSQQQEASSVSLGASAGIDTKYSSDGGYVY